MRRTLSLLAALLLRLRVFLATPVLKETPPVFGQVAGRQDTSAAGDGGRADPWVTPDGQPTERFSSWN